MTMFPTHHRHHLSSSKHVNGGFYNYNNCFISLGRGFSDLMAKDDDHDQSRIQTNTGSRLKDAVNVHEDDDDDDHHSRWLQLSLGGGYSPSSATHHHQIQIQPPPLQPQLVFQVPEFRGHDLRPTSMAAMNSVPLMALQQQHQNQNNYNYLQLIRPFPANFLMTTTTLNNNLLPVSSSSSFSGSSEQLQGRSVHVHRRLNLARVVNPPRRFHSGFWFMLQASQNQAKEPFLPQVQKSYLRIKDGRMSVGLLMKYLVNKLELGSESEIEITCKGQKLMLHSTLQHVRDTIWNSPRNDIGFIVVPQSSATANHLMVLNYGRTA